MPRDSLGRSLGVSRRILISHTQVWKPQVVTRLVVRGLNIGLQLDLPERSRSFQLATSHALQRLEAFRFDLCRSSRLSLLLLHLLGRPFSFEFEAPITLDRVVASRLRSFL